MPKPQICIVGGHKELAHILDKVRIISGESLWIPTCGDLRSWILFPEGPDPSPVQMRSLIYLQAIIHLPGDTNTRPFDETYRRWSAAIEFVLADFLWCGIQYLKSSLAIQSITPEHIWSEKLRLIPNMKVPYTIVTRSVDDIILGGIRVMSRSDVRHNPATYTQRTQ